MRTAPAEVRNDALLREHLRRLRAYALALAPREDVAEDLLQEALLVAHTSRERFDDSRDFGAWVRGIVRMKYLEWTRRKRVQALDEAVLDSIDARHRAWDEAPEDALAALRSCIQHLPEHLRPVIELFYLRRHSCAAIARSLGTSEIVVRKRLQRAREHLAGCVRERTE